MNLTQPAHTTPLSHLPEEEINRDVQEVVLNLPREAWAQILAQLHDSYDISGPGGERFQSGELERLIGLIRDHVATPNDLVTITMSVNQWQSCVSCLTMIIHRDLEAKKRGSSQ